MICISLFPKDVLCISQHNPSNCICQIAKSSSSMLDYFKTLLAFLKRSHLKTYKRRGHSEEISISIGRLLGPTYGWAMRSRCDLVLSFAGPFTTRRDFDEELYMSPSAPTALRIRLRLEGYNALRCKLCKVSRYFFTHR